jgi:AcrR family transcriptional regulator
VHVNRKSPINLTIASYHGGVDQPREDVTNDSPREQANAAVRDFLFSRDWSAQTPARQRIPRAFLRLATAHGFNSVTMRTLGRELDMKAPSLYSSFPRGKDEIVAESLRWFTH